ncbi:MAG: protein kinase [Sandaracinus sp.]
MGLDDNLDLPRPFGPYTLLRRLAVGGMAEVYVGKTKGIGGFEKLAAIKVIHPRYSEDDHFLKMLVEEAKISVLLTHVNIAQTFDLGQHEGTYYIAMELVEGADAYRVMRKCADAKKALPLDVCAFVVSEMCNGLDYAHRKRDPHTQQPLHIVHRDISPQNVLISFAGEVKIVDFGIAKATSRSEHTEAGVIKGKYYYMSPEQAWGDPMDHRSDIFSTGVVLYELLTGRMLYNDDNIPVLLDKVRKAEIAPPEKRRPSIPKSLSDIVMRALQKDAADRYQSAQEFGHVLTQWLYTNSPTFSATRLGDLMSALFPEEIARAAALGEAGSSGLLNLPQHRPAPVPQVQPKPAVQLSSLADLGEDEEDVTRHDVLPYRKAKSASASAVAVPAPVAAPAAAGPEQRATFRPQKGAAASRETAPLPQPAPLPSLQRPVEAITTSPLTPKHEPTEQTGNVEQWEDPTNLRDDEAPAALRDAGRAAMSGGEDFEDSTVVDSQGLYKQVRQGLAGQQVVESARGRVVVKQPPVQGTRPGSVPPPPSRAAWAGKPVVHAPPSPQPAARAPQPAQQILATYGTPSPGPAIEDQTIPLSAAEAELVQRALAAPQVPRTSAPQAFTPPPARTVSAPPSQGPWPVALPTYAQPTRPIHDPFHAPEQPTVPRGADPFAPPPPAQPLPAELGGPAPSRLGTYVIVLLGLLAIGAVAVWLAFPRAASPEISIISIPTGAEVFMGPRSLGIAPVLVQEDLEVGNAYEFTVTHPGYQPWHATIQAQPGPVQQTAILAALPASLHVDTTPPGGLVTVGGSPRGVAPVDVDGFLVGQSVEVRASRPGNVPVIQSVVLDSEHTSVTLTVP